MLVDRWLVTLTNHHPFPLSPTRLQLWREPSHNPSGLSVTSRELWHTTTGLLTLTRTGGASGDHVDVLGNIELAAELLQLVSGDDGAVVGQDRYYSNIEEMAGQVRLT